MRAQLNRNIPGGMLIVFDGTVGAGNHAFLGTIKAETQSGFRRHEDEKKRIITEFLNNVFLTPATRLFKIAMFVVEDRKRKYPAAGDPLYLIATFRKAIANLPHNIFMKGFSVAFSPRMGHTKHRGSLILPKSSFENPTCPVR